MNEYIVRYTGPDSVDLRKGELYRAHDLKDSSKLIGVKDQSGEWYAYPKEFFERVDARK